MTRFLEKKLRENDKHAICVYYFVNGCGKCAGRTNYETTVRKYIEYRSLIDQTTFTRLSRMRGKLKLE